MQGFGHPLTRSLLQGPHTRLQFQNMENLPGTRGMTTPESPPLSPLKLALNQPPKFSSHLLPAEFTDALFKPEMMMFGEEPAGLEAPVPEETATGSVSGISPSLPPEASTDKAYSLVNLYVCFYCDEDFSTTEDLVKHRKVCKHTSPISSDDMCTPTRPSALSVSARSKLLSARSNMDKWSFTSALGLHSITKRRNLRVNTRKKINLDKIDVDRELPRSPTTPRTPKSLISQLSRVSENEVSDVDSDCGKPESSEDGKARTKWNRLLSIEISSFLGQKLKPHLTVIAEDKTQKTTDYEHYCKTPIKNAFLERLRTRPSLPKVAYKPRRMHQSYHMYKFNKRQTREFMLKMKTGLTKKSRTLKKKMVKMTVDLHKLDKKDLLKYRVSKDQLKDLGFLSKARKFDPEATKPSEFPSVPVLRENEDKLRNLLGLRTNNSVPIRRSLLNELNLSQVVSEDVLAEVMKQQVVVYKSVLSELTDSPMSANETTSKTVTKGVLCNKPGGESADKAGSDCDSTSSRLSRRERRKRDFSEVSSDTDICSPKRKKVKRDFRPEKIKPNVTGVFSCGICGFEMTVDNNVQKAVELHFGEKHNINDVTIHKDSSDSLVVVRSPVRKTPKVSYIDLTLDSDDDCKDNEQNTKEPKKADEIHANKNEDKKLPNEPRKLVLPRRSLRSNSDSSVLSTKIHGNSQNDLLKSVLMDCDEEKGANKRHDISGDAYISEKDHNSNSVPNSKVKKGITGHSLQGNTNTDYQIIDKKKSVKDPTVDVRHSPRRGWSETQPQDQTKGSATATVNGALSVKQTCNNATQVVPKPSKSIAVVERPVTRRYKKSTGKVIEL